MFNELQRRASAGFMAFAMILANVLLPAMPAMAWTANPSENTKDNKKSYVCKMVGTPGVNEVLQTGNNPIQIDRKDSHAIGAMFVDAQGGSYVVGYGFPNEKQADGPQLSDCINMTKPTPTVELDVCTPGVVGTDDVKVTVINNDAISGNTAVYTVKVGNQTQVSNALTDGQSQTLTFSGLTAGSQSVTISAYGQQVYTGSVTIGSCQEEVGRLATPVVELEGVCGIENDEATIPTSDDYTAGVPFWSEGKLGVTFTIKNGVNKVFAENGEKTITVYVDEENTENCPLVTVKPGIPQFTDLCGRSNDTYILPTTDNVTYSAVKNGNNVTVTATPDQGYSLDLTGVAGWTLEQNGTATYTFKFTNEKCDKVTICHRTNSVTNPYRKISVSVNAADGISGNSGKRADHFDEHQGPIATSEAFAQSLKDNKQKWGDIIPPIDGIHNGYNWPEGQAMYENDCKYILEVTPEMPSVVDICYSDEDYVSIPNATEGYYYLYDGEDASGEAIQFKGEAITVTAVAKNGYKFASDAKTSWTFTSEDFSDEECLTIVKEFKSVTDTNKDGKIGIDDTITWEITVTNTSDDEVFNIVVKDEDADTLENDGKIDYLGAGKSKTLAATSTITLDQAAVCEVENTATFSARRAQLYALERLMILNDNENSEGAHLTRGSATDTYTWECVPGQGGNETPETPKTPETPATPVIAVLPNTSGSITQVVAVGVLSLAGIILVAGTAIKSRLLA